MASLQLIFSWNYCPDEMKASPRHIYLCSAGFWYHTTGIHPMVRVPQNIFFWNASAVFGKLRNSILLTPTTTYEETFISIEICIVSLLLLLKTAPAILNCHAWISSKSAQILSLNFRKFAGGQAPSTTLHYIFTREAEQSEQRPQNPVSPVCCQPWEPNSLLWTPK